MGHMDCITGNCFLLLSVLGSAQQAVRGKNVNINRWQLVNNLFISLHTLVSIILGIFMYTDHMMKNYDM